MREPDSLLNLVDYNARFTGLLKTSHVNVIQGDLKYMKKSAEYNKDTVDSYTKSIGELYLRGRYVNISCITIPKDNIIVAENVIRDFRSDLETAIDTIIDYLCNQYPDTIIVNAVVRDIWLHGGAHQYIALDEYKPLFERKGFRDTDLKVIKGVTMPRHLQAYVPNYGGNGIVDNFDDWF